jgi:hypothetical protein
MLWCWFLQDLFNKIFSQARCIKSVHKRSLCFFLYSAFVNRFYAAFLWDRNEWARLWTSALMNRRAYELKRLSAIVTDAAWDDVYKRDELNTIISATNFKIVRAYMRDNLFSIYISSFSGGTWTKKLGGPRKRKRRCQDFWLGGHQWRHIEIGPKFAEG